MSEPKLAKVIPIHVDGVYVRCEEGLYGDVHWIERRRGLGTYSAIAYELDELEGLYERLGKYLRARGRVR